MLLARSKLRIELAHAIFKDRRLGITATVPHALASVCCQTGQEVAHESVDVIQLVLAAGYETLMTAPCPKQMHSRPT